MHCGKDESTSATKSCLVSDGTPAYKLGLVPGTTCDSTKDDECQTGTLCEKTPTGSRTAIDGLCKIKYNEACVVGEGDMCAINLACLGVVCVHNEGQVCNGIVTATAENCFTGLTCVNSLERPTVKVCKKTDPGVYNASCVQGAEGTCGASLICTDIDATKAAANFKCRHAAGVACNKTGTELCGDKLTCATVADPAERTTGKCACTNIMETPNAAGACITIPMCKPDAPCRLTLGQCSCNNIAAADSSTDVKHCGTTNTVIANIESMKCDLANSILVSACTNGNCVECPTADGACTKCKIDFTPVGNTSCTPCGDGKFSNGIESCAKCITNCKTCTTNEQAGCSACSDGYIADATNGATTACDACSTGCKTCSVANTEDKCLTCNDGYNHNR